MNPIQPPVVNTPAANEAPALPPHPDHHVAVPPVMRRLLYVVFMWCLLGIAAAYGMRFWNDSPVHPSFLPFVGIAFAAILSFVVVMVFRSIAGELQFRFGAMSFTGASGPIIFWAICFLTVCLGGSLLGFADAVKKPPVVGYMSCGAFEIALGRCTPKLQNTSDGTASVTPPTTAQ